MLLQCLFIFLAVSAFCVLFEVPVKLVPVGGLIGAVCWFVYLVMIEVGLGLYAANFIAAIAVAILSDILAFWLKQPAPMFFVPGILPIVPGSSLYYTVYNFAVGNHAEAQAFFIKSVNISVLIALSIFFVDSLFRIIWTAAAKKEHAGKA